MTKSIPANIPGTSRHHWVPRSWELPDSIASRLGQSPGRQRLIAEEDEVLAVLHQPPLPDEEHRRAFLLWRTRTGEWRGASNGRESGEGLTALRHHLGAFHDRIVELDQRADTARGASDYFAVLGSAQPLHRTARNLHRALQELRERVPDEPEVLVSRDRAYEVERSAELLVEDARNGLEYTVAKESEAQSKVASSIAEESRRLNQLAAVCLPLSALSAVVGASLPTGLESLPSPLAFWALIGAALGLGVLLQRRIRASAP